MVMARYDQLDRPRLSDSPNSCGEAGSLIQGFIEVVGARDEETEAVGVVDLQ